ncbi:MAG TPA: DUF3109 domain-containing protein [Flavobacteriales bacterium]|jgi:hypothetical protein|nr:DUF3109 domain-containing protein [Flavobacteriales bacterium]
MIELGNTIISTRILNEEFVCNLSACKGQCCVEGDSGAPLTDEENRLIPKLVDAVHPFLSKKSIVEIEKQGSTVFNHTDNEWETPLVENKECAYAIIDEEGVAACSFEKAYDLGLTEWRKPMSCHLYPARIKEHKRFTAVNFDEWEICSPACTLGQELQVPVYKFLKDALIRRFGQAWYNQLEEVAQQIKDSY